MDFEKIVLFINYMMGFFFGPADGLLYALIAFVVLDYITGVCVAVHKKQLSSAIGAKGIARKVMIFALISVSHIIDSFLLYPVELIKIVTVTFYASNECISIMENAAQLGLPLPDKLKQAIVSFKKSGKIK